MEKPSVNKHILVAPLDWGLGHTARCVPVVQCLLARGCQVTAVGEEWQQSFYEQTFPHEVGTGVLRLCALDGYNVRYAKTGTGFLPRMLRQWPRILRTIRAEHDWLRAFVEAERIDGIISDNRYGLHLPTVPSVILTHQLSPRTGLGSAMDAGARNIHYRTLKKFSACWVVDKTDGPGLSGALAHPRKLPENARYIGLLSQFSEGQKFAATEDVHGGPLLVLLSGPEPQRTLLAKKLWAQVQQHNGPVVFVEGREDAPVPEVIPAHIRYYRRLTSTALKPLLEVASTIICRSGYSTLMDLAALGKRAIIIPTPGQTEQEYLAKLLHARGVFYAAQQADFLLKEALLKAESFPFRREEPAGAFEAFVPVLHAWLEAL